MSYTAIFSASSLDGIDPYSTSALWVKKVGAGKKLVFFRLTTVKFQTEKILPCVQNFNSASEVFTNFRGGEISAPFFVFLEVNFPTGQNLKGGIASALVLFGHDAAGVRRKNELIECRSTGPSLHDVASNAVAAVSYFGCRRHAW